MLIRGIEWKAKQLLNEDALSSRTALTGENIDSNDILEREWY